jgi:hypothetical protein
MRTTTTALFAMLASMGCAQLGHPGGHRSDGPDAGTTAATCDQVETKTMDMTFAGSDMSYAGLPTSCWKLAGKLTIMGTVASLAKLGDLREVQDLEINAGALTTIDTTGDLKVTRTVNIHDTTKLVDLGKLKISADPTCLSYVASVNVTGNSALTDLKGLQDVMCVAGALTIKNNVSLTSITFDNAHRLEGGVTIQDNTKLTTVSFNNVDSMTHGTTLDALVIRHNINLTTINTMGALKFMHGSVTIDGNDKLTSLSGLFPTTFPNIEGSLTITNNSTLTDLGQVSHLGQVYQLVDITSNPQVQYCDAHAVGCCVPHFNQANVSGTGTNNCHSWCRDTQNCYSTN